MLVCFALLLAFNQVVIKVTNGGFQPVFLAGLRSLLALVALLVWMWLRGITPRTPANAVWAGLLLGSLFGFEFVCLFLALDLTTVARASVLFYTMPVWTALGAHFLIPTERLTGLRIAGLVLALGGAAWALADRGGGAAGQAASLAGDLLALAGAAGWAGIALTVRATPAARLSPEQQLLWQLAVSAPILFVTSLFFGPFLRDPAPIHFAGLAFQAFAVASSGFLFWFWLLTRYPAAGVASFGFLTPVFSVLMGWQLLDEPVGPGVIGGLVLVVGGLILINRPPRRPPG